MVASRRSRSAETGRRAVGAARVAAPYGYTMDAMLARSATSQSEEPVERPHALVFCASEVRPGEF